METSPASNPSTPTESEATMDCQLLLTTLAGNEVVVSMNIAQFDRFDDFEEHIVFLHGWRRHVCRDCTGHLALVKKELLAR